jgi:DNA processing protein
MIPNSWTREDVLGLSLLPRVKAIAVRGAVERFAGLEAMIEAAPPEFEHVGIIRGSLFPSRVIDNIRDLAAEQLERCAARKVQIITLWDEEYPAMLRHIYYPPVVLYVRGALQASDAATIGMVGTRHCTDYGRIAAEQYATVFVQAGVVVVSGLAMGIDSYVHKAVLAAQGVTYAVIASGVDKISSSQAEKVAQEISEQGAVVSEYPCGTAATQAYFPQRNRIISGIAKAIVVVESGEKGGSLITARFALDQNRELFAIPGKIFSERSRGTNLLIQRTQAQLTLDPNDVLAALGWKPHSTLPPTASAATQQASASQAAQPQLAFEFTPDEQRVYELLSDVPMHIDEIATHSGLAMGDLLVVMLEMEFKNAVRQLAGKQFVKV